MLFNFFKITLRNFRKNKSYVFINLLGLGLSIACCIVGYLNWKFASNYDQNHVNHEKIYKLQITKSVQDRDVPYGITPLPLGAQIKDKIAGVSHTSRYVSTGLVLKKDLKVFNQSIGFADDDFFEMFTFPFKYGNKEALLDRSNIILSSNTAESYFGDTDPVGKIILIISEEGEQYPMTVGGVLEDIPMNSSISFRAITHFENYLKIRSLESNNWKRFVSGTFVMTDGSYPRALLDDVNENYIAIQNEARDDFQIASYFLEPLTTLGKNAQDIRSNWLNQPPPPPAIVAPMIMAILMLLIACFNFTNTSIAISSKRLKEIGIRKVMGSNRKQLIFQFLGENLVLSFGGMIVGLLIAMPLVPVYSAMWDFINLELDLSANTEIYFFLLGLLVFTSLIAGGYPSLYISSFQPVKILRGNMSLGGANLFSKSLLGAQYGITAIALISSLAFSNNAKYQANYDVGFETENMLAVRAENQSEYEKFSNLVSQMPEINSLTGTTHHIGWWTYGRTLRSGEKEIEADMMNFTIDYKEVMGLKMVEGRYFDPELYDSDRKNSIILNETLVKQFGWEEPIGQRIQTDDSTRLTVIGVMKDFYMQGFFNPVQETAIRLADKDQMNFLVVKSDLSRLELKKALEEKWYEIAPNTPFNYDEETAVTNAEEVNLNIMKMFRALGLLALVLSSIGLYTLVSLNVIKRVKEIGVRKVLGASINNIILLVNRQFFWLLVIAAVVGSALSYFAIDALMASIFSVYQAVSYFTILAPLFLLLFIAFSIASARIFKTATQNPVKSLRYE